MKYILTNPFIVGDLQHQHLVDSLVIGSIAIDMDPTRPATDPCVLSLMLVHAESGYKANIVYRDQEALDFWRSIVEGGNDVVTRALFRKLIADGKLPQGTLNETTATL